MDWAAVWCTQTSPAGSARSPEPFVIGLGGGSVNSVMIVGTTTDQHGRVLSTVFEVILYG